MSKQSGGQLPSEPNRKTGSKPHGGKGFGQVTPQGGNPNPKRFGQQHVTKNGQGQGGSGSARKK